VPRRMGFGRGGGLRTRSPRLSISTRVPGIMSGCLMRTSRRVSTRSITPPLWVWCVVDRGQTGPRFGQSVPQGRYPDRVWSGERDRDRHPQGGILSPLLANIALSVLDEHIERAWEPTQYARATRKRRGLANFIIVRYADDFRGDGRWSSGTRGATPGGDRRRSFRDRAPLVGGENLDRPHRRGLRFLGSASSGDGNEAPIGVTSIRSRPGSRSNAPGTGSKI